MHYSHRLIRLSLKAKYRRYSKVKNVSRRIVQTNTLETLHTKNLSKYQETGQIYEFSEAIFVASTVFTFINVYSIRLESNRLAIYS